MAVIGLMRTVLREDAIFRGWKKKKKEKKKNRSCIFIFSLFRFCFFWRRSIDFSLEIPSILLLLLLSIEHITVRFLFLLLPPLFFRSFSFSRPSIPRTSSSFTIATFSRLLPLITPASFLLNLRACVATYNTVRGPFYKEEAI